MKKIIFLILTIAFNYSFSQNLIDSLLFMKINNYRQEYGLKPLSWESDIFNMANHHTKYQILVSNQTHEESIDVAGFNEYNKIEHRVDKFISSYQCNYYGECIATVIAKENNPKSEISIAEEAIYLWKNSPGHNRLLLDINANKGACSVEYKIDKWTWEHKGKKITEYILVYSVTFNFTN